AVTLTPVTQNSAHPLYHFFTWTIGTPDSASVLGRLGIYAVSTFYIVSGMSMFVAYQRSTWSPREILFFVTKRYLRLAPAFWLACTLVVVFLAYTSPTFVIPPEKYIGNYTLTFGFTAPNQYLTVGGWSIGNEMVFYAFFPLVMMIPKIRPALVVSSLAVTLYFYIHYSFFK
uniref:acyltransferase family protein n=1 Tax=Pseudomonas aeruginosa TaxID=287 RepID=UPI00235935CD